jgi:hypothetical protein
MPYNAPQPRKGQWSFNKSFDPLSDSIDRVWSGKSSDSDQKFNHYYDYYFSPEDIKVYIDGLYDPQDELDIAAFAFSVKQEKQPVYGFWSYNYDTVLLGTRIITGVISVVTRYPRRMTELLEKAAKNRVINNPEKKGFNSTISSLYPSMSSSEDERNIEKYWAYSQLDRVTTDPATQSGGNTNNIFSAHPPFNFVVLYGAEETALSPLAAVRDEDVAISSNLDRMLLSDINERSVKIGSSVGPMKIVIQQVNLTDMHHSYSSGDAEVLKETYQFIARDFYYTEADLSFVKNLTVNSHSDSDTRTYDELRADPDTTWSY